MTLDNCAKSILDDVLLEHVRLTNVVPLAVHLNFFGWASRGNQFKTLLLFGIWVWGECVVAHVSIKSEPVPLGLIVWVLTLFGAGPREFLGLRDWD